MTSRAITPLVTGDGVRLFVPFGATSLELDQLNRVLDGCEYMVPSLPESHSAAPMVDVGANVGAFAACLRVLAMKSYRTFGYDPARVPNEYLANLDSPCTDLGEAVAATGLSIGYPGWILVYSIVLCHLSKERTNYIVETGTNWASTTIIIAQALRDSGVDFEFHTVELDSGCCHKARTRIEEAGLGDAVVAHQGRSCDVLPELLERLGRIRIAFLDADHRTQQVLSEFALVHAHLEGNGIVIFDNTAAAEGVPGVNAALGEIRAVYGGNLVNFECVSWNPPGIAVWQRQPFPERSTRRCALHLAGLATKPDE